LHGLARTHVPRRTRSSTQTTAIRPPLKRIARTEETPTLPLTPIEVDSIVQGAEASSVLHADAPTRPTIEIFRPALGSSPIPTVEQAAIVLPAPLAEPAAASTEIVPVAEPAASTAIAPAPMPAPASTTPSPPRGPRRTREMFHRDAIRPPNRKP
jgi:hypothetical protein